MFFEIEGPALARNAIRMLDRRAIDEFEIPGLILMENAGLWAAFTALEILDWDMQKRVVVFAGKGNNGGDGFVLARHLHNRGFYVEVCVLGGFDGVKEESDGATNLKIIQNMNLPLREIFEDQEWPDLLEDYGDYNLAVDALLGTGLDGEVRSPYEEMIGTINALPMDRLAIDIPSGLNADTGEVLGACVRADYTVTFGAKKVGFYKKEGKAQEYTGEIVLVDISLPREIIPDV